ncbi:MAG: endonuclease/exonuclease/phosphatase family protein [Clostridia bacterium]|nr:endonuclease/exonuclease/phosphatase family protein [Clostridia bacterium]
MKNQIKVMSFNLRLDGEWDGINRFRNRIPRIMEVIEKEDPDIIGFQEVTEYMRGVMRENLKGYTVVGCGRGKELNDEAMLIAFKHAECELIFLDNVWLSSTPRIFGSRYGGDQSGCPRMYTVARLKHKNIDTPFYFLNTHLDHEGENARYLGSTQLVQAISELNEKFVMTGDFNATPDSKEIKLITKSLEYRGAIDCTEDLGPTFHAFAKWPKEKWVKIDYIFTDGKKIDAYAVADIMEDGKFYSDHNAVVSIIEI